MFAVSDQQSCRLVPSQFANGISRYVKCAETQSLIVEYAYVVSRGVRVRVHLSALSAYPLSTRIRPSGIYSGSGDEGPTPVVMSLARRTLNRVRRVRERTYLGKELLWRFRPHSVFNQGQQHLRLDYKDQSTLKDPSRLAIVITYRNNSKDQSRSLKLHRYLRRSSHQRIFFHPSSKNIS